jgi:thiol-disulfide isomerase/thioredoxin
MNEANPYESSPLAPALLKVRSLRKAPFWSVALLGAFSLSSCSTPSETDLLREGWWRGVLVTPGGELPFGLDIQRNDNRWVAWLQNGDERVQVSEVDVQGDRLTMRMPGYENRIEALIDGDRLEGSLLMVKAKGADQRISFSAQYGLRHRFTPPSESPDDAGQPIALTGTWAVAFNDSTKTYPAVGEFFQQGQKVTGTFLTPTGDHRFLEGEFDGKQLLLSKFDGGHVFLYRARIDEKGQLSGRFWSGLASEETFTAERDAQASLANIVPETRMTGDSKRLDFRFPDLAGHYISINDPFFRGKVVLVVLAGSWCPNCHDEAAFLAELHKARRDEGLEIISLMFEQLEDPAAAAEAVYRFRDRHRIQYTTLLAGNSDKIDAASKLPQLDAVLAFPTTIFIDRGGNVRSIHTGFAGPATGRHFDELVNDFNSRINALITEPVPANLQPAPPVIASEAAGN